MVAETAGDTVITDCFALVTVSSALETIETYAGGITSILGAGGNVENSYATGLIDSDEVTGGFVAVNDLSLIHISSGTPQTLSTRKNSKKE